VGKLPRGPRQHHLADRPTQLDSAKSRNEQASELLPGLSGQRSISCRDARAPSNIQLRIRHEAGAEALHTTAPIFAARGDGATLIYDQLGEIICTIRHRPIASGTIQIDADLP